MVTTVKSKNNVIRNAKLGNRNLVAEQERINTTGGPGLVCGGPPEPLQRLP